MNGKQSTWFRILFSVALAFLFGLLAYVPLMALPAAATNQFPNWSNGWTPLAPLADAGAFTVTGTVNRQDGTPVGNVQVYAFNATASVETFTNSSGQYTLTLIVGNFYDIVFNPPVETDLASQFRRGVHEGQQGQPLDVTLPPGHSILGTVYSDTTQSNPVQGVEIFAFNKTTAEDFGLPPTQENGTYRISLEEALWELTFTPPPFMGLGPVRTTINLTGDITKDIILQPGFTVYGQVTMGGGGGQAGVEIFAQQPSQPSGYGFRPTGPGGFYTGTLPLGNFDCLFVAPPFLGLGSTVVTNVSGPPDAERNLELPAGHTVSGTVRCDGGVANAFVFAAPQPPVFAASFGGWGRFAGADGFYALALQTGVYTFTVVPPNDSALPELTVPMVEVQEDLTLDFDLCTPTAITLVSFEATASVSEVQLTWETASEIDTVGFNIWRSDVEDGPYTKLNTNLIPAQGTTTTGASYGYTDTTVAEGATYYYKLEDVDNSDVSTFHGPVSATLPHTIFLPIVLKNLCQSTRPPLQGTANFAGEVEILTPPNGTTGIPAEFPLSVEGTYTGATANVTLWVLAYPPDSGYYIQSPNACQGEPPRQYGGYWQVPVYLGEKGGDPECFDIVVILTDQEASQSLSNSVRLMCQSGQYWGILAEQLNNMAITEKSYITVQTMD